jgi:putative phosphonate catabolism associated alcohol dehydrogenase
MELPMGRTLPHHAKAAVCEAPNTPLVIRELPLREVRREEALVRVTISSICRSDLHAWHGRRPHPCPGILGHEIIGVIERLGADVGRDLRGKTLAEGDRVTWTEYFWSDDPYYLNVLDLPHKTPRLGKYGHESLERDPGLLGGFAEYCYLVPRTGILKLPDTLSDREAVPLNCGVATMIAVSEAAGLRPGDAVVIQGLGLLGLYGCAIARARGARLVVGLDPVPARVELARRFGAHEAILVAGLSGADVAERARASVGTQGADVVIEVCGNPAVVPAGIGMLRVGGRYVLAGLVNPGSAFELDGNDVIRGLLTIRGVHNYHPRHLVQAADFVQAERDRFPFETLVDALFPLDQINAAFQRAADRTALRAAIVPPGM